MTERATVLIVDDDPFIAELLTILLESRGFAVETRSDGIDAVELQHDYDVILLDLNMPVFDGERLTAYWQLTRPDVLEKVIVLSAYGRRFDRQTLPTFGAIAKPFDHDELLRVVDACIARQRQRQQSV